MKAPDLFLPSLLEASPPAPLMRAWMTLVGLKGTELAKELGIYSPDLYAFIAGRKRFPKYWRLFEERSGIPFASWKNPPPDLQEEVLVSAMLLPGLDLPSGKIIKAWCQVNGIQVKDLAAELDEPKEYLTQAMGRGYPRVLALLEERCGLPEWRAL